MNTFYFYVHPTIVKARHLCYMCHKVSTSSTFTEANIYTEKLKDSRIIIQKNNLYHIKHLKQLNYSYG